ncbi:hypothetical protein J4Q44_G00347050 [Coregonus suidteri]|uniref:Galectin n=1 Tax=Coregonus suidteri TaxID=861788 RepID=A0AAN8KIP0_9TELE
MVSGPVRSNQGVLSGRHSPANSPPNPRPCPAFLGSPAPPAGLVHNHPNQPQLRLNLSQCLVFLGSPTPPAGLGNSHPNQPQLKTGLGHSHHNQSQLQPKTGTGLAQGPSQPSVPGWPVPGLDPGSGWPLGPGQDPSGFTPAPQWNPTPAVLNVPYNLNLQRGIYDKMMITIMGQVKPNAKQFTVNFLRGNDIAFHLNSRFNEGGKQAVVRNTKVGEHWGKEERHTQGSFPFMAGQSFEMKILVTSGEFKVAVNGAQLFEFKHRVKELNQIDRINILYDVILTSINVDTIP